MVYGRERCSPHDIINLSCRLRECAKRKNERGFPQRVESERRGGGGGGGGGGVVVTG